MSKAKSTKCYIEEYQTSQGQAGARLREKVTGREVNLRPVRSMEDPQHFHHFLSMASSHKSEIQHLFSKDSDEGYVFLSGDLDLDAPDELKFIQNDNISYHFA